MVIMKSAQEISENVFLVGGPDLSDSRDCLCYLAAGAEARVLIDCGCGPSAGAILDCATAAGGGPPTHLLLTHAHIDHAGGAAEIKSLTGCEIVIHDLEAVTLAAGDSVRSAAHWYGLKLPPAQPDRTVTHNESIDLGGGQSLHLVHTPGHTPGSVAAWCNFGGEKVLFGQDIHGPFSPDFGSDVGAWRVSMERLLDLEADVLAEGHYGIYQPAPQVEKFIRAQLRAHGK